jgi:HD-GYP domain-containing protein (c-di-GMP phosphodiesterase class II)
MGKLSVPYEILQKPGALTEDEYAVIRRHPDWGGHW